MARQGLRRIAIALVLVASAQPALAQIPASELPGRERDRFVQPRPPLSQPRGAAIALPGTVAPPGAENLRVVVRAVRIEGGTVYSAAALEPLYRDIVGREVAVSAIYDVAQRITAKYGGDGYVLSRAIVPPQDLNPRGALVRIQIVEGYIDRVEWPASLARYRDFFSYYTSKITAERPINVRTLERYLLLASDLPGLKFTNSLKASETQPGAATLIVAVVEKPLDVFSRVDNRGTRARGPTQYLSTLTVNNLGRVHEQIALTTAGAFQFEELQYWMASYRQVLTPEGLTLFVNASRSRSRPGTEALQALEYKTRGNLFEAGLTYPVIRSREKNLLASALFFMSNDHGDTLGTPNSLDRLRGFRLRTDADFIDPLRATNQINLVVSQGIEGLGSSQAGADNLSRANGRPDFTKVEATVSRLQPLPANFSLLLAAYGQWARTPLLAPELCGYGGRVFGRAYDPSELVGDSCIELLAELRYDVSHSLQNVTQLQLYGFVDRGWLHNLAPVPGTPEDVDGASVGGGVRVGLAPAVTVDLSTAKGIAGMRDDWRFFFITTGRF
ncbi:MAG: ShlB/FhaC/HecB family hemolysin secretion/activation protein [Hyphomicrobiales bacterium]|nr:ShlB/FhaC/HecB family hemolysin secretion/activation protein [Hyphomicrobiales bacterium]